MKNNIQTTEQEMHLLNFKLSKDDFYRLNVYCTEKGCIPIAWVLRELISNKLNEEGIKSRGTK